MALRLIDEYPGRVDGVSAAYPNGTYKDESVSGAEDGTPVARRWKRDEHGFTEALLAEADITPNGFPDSATDSQRLTALKMITARGTRPPRAQREAICSGTPMEQWADPAGDENLLEVGYNVIDSCVGWNYSVDRPQLFFTCSDNQVRWSGAPWNYKVDPAIGAPLGLVYATTPSHVLGLCSDAEFLYVVYRAQLTGELRVSKYSVLQFTGSSVWDIGLGEVIADDTDKEYVKIIIANNAALAVSVPHINGTSINGVAIIAKGSGALLKGSGNNSAYTIIADAPHYGKLVSDNYHVHWIGKSGTSSLTFYLASATITDPTTSSFSLQTLASGVDSANGHLHYKGLVNLGEGGGLVLTHNPAGQIIHFDKSRDVVHGTVQIADFGEAPSTLQGDYDVMMGADGLNVWIHCVALDYVNTSTPAAVLFRVPRSVFSNRAGYSGTAVFRDIHPTRTHIAVTGLQNDYPAGKLLYDGTDMWAVWRTGYGHRICNPLGR